MSLCNIFLFIFIRRKNLKYLTLKIKSVEIGPNLVIMYK